MKYEYKANSLHDIIGHRDLLNQDGIINKIINKQLLTNLIFYGPSGIGKTTLVNVLIKQFKNIEVIDFNPLVDKKEKLVDFIKKETLFKKVVVINEIHNLNKDKQEILLEGMQNKTIYLFATTNFNPYLNITSAVISRSFIIKMNNVDQKEIQNGLIQILNNYQLNNDYSDVINSLISSFHNDLRKIISTLFLIINLYDDQKLNLQTIKTFIANNQVFEAESSDEFHDLKSAFHKSLRGSDPDASLYYLYRLMQTGDYKAIYRRLICAAYEDVGLANPNITLKVMSAINACLFLGEAESFQVLAYITLEIALSPKSNSAWKALSDVETFVKAGNVFEVPIFLKNGSLKNDSFSKNKTQYKYPHDYKNHWVKQDYLPNEIKDKVFYHPDLNNQYETKILEYWNKIKNK